MKATIFSVFLVIIIVLPLNAGVRESHSAESAPVTLNFYLPDVAVRTFPSNGETGMPQQVTVVWYYGQDPLRTATEFEIYKDTVFQSTVECCGCGFYCFQISGLSWGSTTHWQVVPVNAAGDCPTLYTWDFSVMAEPSNPEEVPSAVVYEVNQDYSGSDPDPIVLPEIDLGEGDFAPQADFQYGSPVSNFDIGVRFSDQPFQPVLNPENVAAAFSADFPAGVQTSATFTYSGSTVSDELMHWNGSSWETVPGVTFGAGWVSFSFTSTSRGEEQFVVNDGDGTLPVTLSSFCATVTSADLVELEWVTQSETGMMGYNIFRTDEEIADNAARLNLSIIPAQNTPTEQQYTYLDEQVESNGEYYYWLNSIELDGQSIFYGPVSITISEDGGEGDETPPVVLESGIQSIYPNPFNPSTTIQYVIPEESGVDIGIYNLKGELVRNWSHGTQSANTIQRQYWDGANKFGEPVASGIYFIVLKAGKFHESRKAMLLK